MKENSNFNLNDLIEKHKLSVGASLLVLVVASGSFLLWREGYWKPALESRVKSLESRVSELEKNGETTAESGAVDLDKLIAQSQKPAEDQGKVAGAQDSKPVNQSVSESVKPQGKININTATASELDSLPGIGPVYAGRIIEYRDSNGSFKTLEEIQKVKGIGPSTYNKIKDQITL